MLIKLGDAIVDSDEIVYAVASDDDMRIEVLFRSNSKVFNNGKTVSVHSEDPKRDLDNYLRCLVS